MNLQILQAVLTDAVASGAAAGIAAAVTDGSETIFQGAAGVTELGGATAVTPDTLFWIASMTKPLTSLAAMQLVEAGKLSLDAPIGGLLPELDHPQILEAGQLHPASGPITLRQLLTHTAGFSYVFSSAELTAYVAANNVTAIPGTRAALRMPLLFEPGTRWEYGISTDWVGLAVEAASGKSLDGYFKTHITGPLGMRDTTFMPSDEQLTRRAAIHRRQPDGALQAVPASPAAVPDYCSGGGGLYSTLNDYVKFTAMILNGGAGLASPASIAAMSSNQIGTLRAGQLSSADPSVTAAAELFPGQDAKWSFGFLINPERGPLGRNPGCLAWGGLASTFFWIDLKAGIAATILMQVMPSGDLGAVKTFMSFEKKLYAALR